MKKQSTKRALLMSCMSLLLCVSMLIGTTFAWFTDSVTSANNVITSGNLDITLQYQNSEVTAWTDVDEDSNVFMPNALWEPGHTEVIKLKIANVGSLALKYRFGINVASESGSINANGDSFKLSDYIYFGIVDGDKTYASRADAVAAVSATAKQIKDGYAVPGALEANKGADSEKIITLVIYMPETVGNEANHKADAPAPVINLGLNLFATQYELEKDSFGDDYDENAPWTGTIDLDWYTDDPDATEFSIDTAAELAALAALVNGTATATQDNFQGQTIKLSADIDLNNVPWIPIGNGSNGFCGTLDGNGHKISNLVVHAHDHAGLIGYALNGGNVKNLTVENAYVTATDYAGAIMGRGYTDIDNCHVKNATVITTPYLKNGTYDGGAKAGGIIGQILEGSGNTVTNCSATDVKIYAFRDLGGVVGMVHNNNSVSGNTATNVTLGYILCDQITADENENAGAIYGRVQASATASPAKDSAENQAYTLVYAVYDAMSLTSLANYVNTSATNDGFKGKTVVLLNDIDLNGREWTPIGCTFNKYEFKGNFDGQDHTISNFTVNQSSGAALFGFVRNSASVIKNLTVENVVATGSDYVAGIVGQLYANIENCHAKNVTATATPHLLANGTYDGGAKAGGVVGWIESGSIYTATNCTATNVTVKAFRDLGAVIGMAHNNNVITDCKAYDSALSYVIMPAGTVMHEGKVNENIGEVIGRRGANVTETGTYFENVTIN